MCNNIMRRPKWNWYFCRLRRCLILILVFYGFITVLTLPIKVDKPIGENNKGPKDWLVLTSEQQARLETLSLECSASQSNSSFSALHRKHLLREHPEISLAPILSTSLSYCHVPKAASTGWMAAMARLKNFSQQDVDSMLRTGSLHIVMQSIAEDELEEKGENLNATQRLRFIFARHPFERLASAYHEKLVVNRVQSFIDPLVSYKMGLLGRLRSAWTKKGKTVTDLSFKTFIEFVIHELRTRAISFGSLHWLPISILCDPCMNKPDFVGKVETMEHDLRVLAEAVTELTSISGQMLLSKLNSVGVSGDLTEQYFHQLDDTLVQRLYAVYRDDFKLFGYPYPKKYMHKHDSENVQNKY